MYEQTRRRPPSETSAIVDPVAFGPLRKSSTPVIAIACAPTAILMLRLLVIEETHETICWRECVRPETLGESVAYSAREPASRMADPRHMAFVCLYNVFCNDRGQTRVLA